MRVLVADADHATRSMLDLGEDVLFVAGAEPVDAIVAGDLPDMGATQLARALRAAKIATPLLVCHADDRVAAKVAALSAGADDYLAKPFYREELAARLRALARRGAGLAAGDVVALGDIAVDLKGRTATAAGERVRLTPREFQMLEALILRPGRTLSKEALHALVYGDPDAGAELKIIDVFVCKVRKKLRAAGRQIETVWGQGYRIGALPVGAGPVGRA